MIVIWRWYWTKAVQMRRLCKWVIFEECQWKATLPTFTVQQDDRIKFEGSSQLDIVTAVCVYCAVGVHGATHCDQLTLKPCAAIGRITESNPKTQHGEKIISNKNKRRKMSQRKRDGAEGERRRRSRGMRGVQKLKIKPRERLQLQTTFNINSTGSGYFVHPKPVLSHSNKIFNCCT